jgi:hypothetical protein
MTNALLVQITQQLVNVSTGTPLTIVATQSNQPFKPTASAVRVNVLWFLSLVLSLSCALSATLMQQWSRRYRELAQRHGAPHRRARMRAYIFDGISRFGMARAVATMPTLLHISVFLFFAGLIDFLFPVDATVSWFTLVLVVAFALAYAILTTLPNLYLNCPYATPLSGITWQLSQLLMIVGLKAALGVENIFHIFLFKLWSRVRVNDNVVETAIENWRMAIKNQVKVHRQWLSDGLWKSIERDAKDAPSTVVTSALEWTLSTLDEDKEIEAFAAFVPGFFDSSTVPNATSAILPLMSEKPRADAILGFRLSDLLKTCVRGTSPLKEVDRKRRLRVSMRCLWYFGRAYNRPGASELPPYILSTLASPEIIHRIHTEQDLVARVIGRCFCALVVMKRVDDFRFTGVQASDEVVACLSAILGTIKDDVRLCITWPGTVELATMVSIALGDIDSRVISAMSPDVVDLVQQTLDILSQALPVEAISGLSLDPSTPSINTREGIFSRIIAPRLHHRLQMCITGASPITNEVRTSCMCLCLKTLWNFAKAYHRLGASNPLPPYVPSTLASPAIIHRIQTEQNPVARVIGRCFCALVVMKLAADIRFTGVQASDGVVACLSAVLGTSCDDVRLCLEWPGTVELATMVSIALGDIDSRVISAMPPDVVDLVQQTLDILSQALRAETIVSLSKDYLTSSTNTLGGISDRIIAPCLHNRLQMCITGTSCLTDDVRRGCMRMYLKGLWNLAKAYHRLGASDPLPSYFLNTLATPEIINRIQTEQDPVARVIGHCFSALVIKKMAADVGPSSVRTNDEKLTCLSAILGTRSHEVKLCLRWPGTVEITSMVSISLDEIDSKVISAMPPDVIDLVQRTVNILFLGLPTDGMFRAPPITPIKTLDDIFYSTVLPRLHNRLQMCISGTLPLTDEVRRSCLRMYLKSLWRAAKSYHQPGASNPLSPYFPCIIATPEIIRHTQLEDDRASRVIGLCFWALVVNKLATDFNSRTVRVDNQELEACLSPILGVDSYMVGRWLRHPGTIENMGLFSLALGEVGSVWTTCVGGTEEVDVQDMVQQTFNILSRTIPAGLNTRLWPDWTSHEVHRFYGQFMPVLHNRLEDLLKTCTIRTPRLTERARIKCLESLWHYGIACHHFCAPGSRSTWDFFPIHFITPSISRHIDTDNNASYRVIGHCFESLVVNRFAAKFNSIGGRLGDQEVACLSAILLLSTEQHQVIDWLFQPAAVQLVNVVSLTFGEVSSLFLF